MGRYSLIIIVLAVCGVTVKPARAQVTNSAQQPATSSPEQKANDSREPDLSITAHVTAQSLRFEQVPNPQVKFSGHPERETVWDATREHLPAAVQPGVTYRDIGIRLKITSVFADIDRIVSEALGETVPQTEEQLPQKAKLAAKTPPSAGQPPVPNNQTSQGRP